MFSAVCAFFRKNVFLSSKDGEMRVPNTFSEDAVGMETG
jgi:hypothetical protein